MAQRPVCGSISAPKSVACFDQVVTFTVNLNVASEGQQLTWVIASDMPNNSNGPRFVNSGTRTIQTTATAGTNTITVNVGHLPGVLTVKLKYAATPTQDACSASIKVAANCNE